VQGRGITTRLTGELEVRSTAGLNVPPRVTGEIRTVSGQYRAYSQQLDIESGVASFSGALDNPALNILAIRPNISVRAGVQVTGTAQQPRVKLYSESGLTDAEILSWVVLGRSTANGGAEAALLQQAALALLAGGKGSSGGVAKKLGLDEIGFKGPGSGSDASSAALTFGKRLSQKLYVTYEHGLSGALGSLYIFYDLTRRLTLRGQAGGTKNGLDLIYTLTYN
jgi:translocation and assembly module TamB